MPNMSIPTTFSIDFVGGLTKVNDLTSQVKARVYYRGGNRNGTWITDDFAEKLNQTLYNVPIVASYNSETEDFEGHIDNGNKKAYGFVPPHAEFSWEKADDGKEYLTTDVYLWTGYWPEAEKIINKSQSMEIDKRTISGDWKVINGDFYFVYQTGSFKGLCTLGDAIMPCFENSAFYSLDEESRSFFESLNKNNEKNHEGGNIPMKDNTQTVAVDNSLETEPIVAVDESVAIVEPEATEFAEGDTTEFADGEQSISTNETATTEVIETRDSISINESHSEVVKNEDGSITVISDDNSRWISINTYYALEQEVNTLKEELSQLKNENTSLNEYKKVVLLNEKQEVINKFSKKLSTEEISKFVDSIDSYSTEQLKTELSIVLSDKIMADETVDQEVPTHFVRVPDKENKSGITNILKHYTKK